MRTNIWFKYQEVCACFSSLPFYLLLCYVALCLSRVCIVRVCVHACLCLFAHVSVCACMRLYTYILHIVLCVHILELHTQAMYLLTEKASTLPKTAVLKFRRMEQV